MLTVFVYECVFLIKYYPGVTKHIIPQIITNGYYKNGCDNNCSFGEFRGRFIDDSTGCKLVFILTVFECNDDHAIENAWNGIYC